MFKEETNETHLKVEFTHRDSFIIDISRVGESKPVEDNPRRFKLRVADFDKVKSPMIYDCTLTNLDTNEYICDTKNLEPQKQPEMKKIRKAELCRIFTANKSSYELISIDGTFLENMEDFEDYCSRKSALETMVVFYDKSFDAIDLYLVPRDEEEFTKEVLEIEIFDLFPKKFIFGSCFISGS